MVHTVNSTHMHREGQQREEGGKRGRKGGEGKEGKEREGKRGKQKTHTHTHTYEPGTGRLLAAEPHIRISAATDWQINTWKNSRKRTNVSICPVLFIIYSSLLFTLS